MEICPNLFLANYYCVAMASRRRERKKAIVGRLRRFGYGAAQAETRTAPASMMRFRRHDFYKLKSQVANNIDDDWSICC